MNQPFYYCAYRAYLYPPPEENDGFYEVQHELHSCFVANLDSYVTAQRVFSHAVDETLTQYSIAFGQEITLADIMQFIDGCNYYTVNLLTKGEIFSYWDHDVIAAKTVTFNNWLDSTEGKTFCPDIPHVRNLRLNSSYILKQCSLIASLIQSPEFAAPPLRNPFWGFAPLPDPMLGANR